MKLQRYDSSQVTPVADVLSEAFFDYPVMRFVVGPDHADYAGRLYQLVEFFVYRRARTGAPLLGIEEDGRLVAGAALTLPAGPDPAVDPDVLARRDAMWRALGDDARDRYDMHVQALKGFFSAIGPHHHLNMIGVRRSHAGQGLGRRLLDAVADLSREHPNSCGVSLTTETRDNVALYEHVGYEVVAHAEFAPGLESWGMFLGTTP